MADFKISGSCYIQEIYSALLDAQASSEVNAFTADWLAREDIYITANAGTLAGYRIYSPQDIDNLHTGMEAMDAFDGSEDGYLSLYFGEEGIRCPEGNDPTVYESVRLVHEPIPADFAESFGKVAEEYRDHSEVVGYLQEISANHLLDRVGESALNTVAANLGLYDRHPFRNLAQFLDRRIDRTLDLSELVPLVDESSSDVIGTMVGLQDRGLLEKLPLDSIIGNLGLYRYEADAVLHTFISMHEAGVMDWMPLEYVVDIVNSSYLGMSWRQNGEELAAAIEELHEHGVHKELGVRYVAAFLTNASFNSTSAAKSLLAFNEAGLLQSFSRRQLSVLASYSGWGVADTLDALIALKEGGQLDRIGIPNLLRFARTSLELDVGEVLLALGQLEDDGLLDRFGIQPFLKLADRCGSYALWSVLSFHSRSPLTRKTLRRFVVLSKFAPWRPGDTMEAIEKLNETGIADHIGLKGLRQLGAASGYRVADVYNYLLSPNGRALIEKFSIEKIVKIIRTNPSDASIPDLFDRFLKQ